MSRHTEFIKSQITTILNDAVTASAGIGSGIETYPLCDYVMQSLFLKMTGYQEQKMKCICWEIATYDYDYRRKLLANENGLGEYSSLDAKNKIYKKLIDEVGWLEGGCKMRIRDTATSSIKNIFLGSNLSVWAQQNYNWFSKNYKGRIKTEHFANACLLESCLRYNLLYDHRNRVAHNALSYQQNLPTLKALANDDYQYENYFFRFAILILIDEIFRELYERYLQKLNDSIF